VRREQNKEKASNFHAKGLTSSKEKRRKAVTRCWAWWLKLIGT
jgi:hypothetical protein